MTPTLKVAIALLALTMGTAADARSGVYRWIDNSGNVHYDDQNLLAERITRSTLNAREVAPEPEIALSQDFVDEVSDRCVDFSERAQSYSKTSAIYARDPFGNSYALSRNQIALARADASRLKARFCRPDAARLILIEERNARRAALKAKEKSTVVSRRNRR